MHNDLYAHSLTYERVMNGERKFSLNLATAFAVPGVLVGHRRISLGDEHSLLHEEEEAFRASVLAVRRASGAARIVARQLLGTLGLPKMALPRSKRGPPIWPAGIVASLESPIGDQETPRL